MDLLFLPFFSDIDLASITKMQTRSTKQINGERIVSLKKVSKQEKF